MRILAVAALILMVAVSNVRSIPTSVNYQGTIKEKGTPVTGTRKMVFRLTNADGSVVYWSTPEMSVPVEKGLFSVQLQPDVSAAGYSWETIEPYIEVMVNQQTLLPRERLSAAIYSQVAANVIDGAISYTDLDSNVQSFLVPRGMIAMFGGNCPPGWAVFNDANGRFIVADSVAGRMGGKEQHFHYLESRGTLDNVSVHSLVAGSEPGGGGWLVSYSNGGNLTARAVQDYTTKEDNRPPYYSLVFCRKN